MLISTEERPGQLLVGKWTKKKEKEHSIISNNAVSASPSRCKVVCDLVEAEFTDNAESSIVDGDFAVMFNPALSSENVMNATRRLVPRVLLIVKSRQTTTATHATAAAVYKHWHRSIIGGTKSLI